MNLTKILSLLMAVCAIQLYADFDGSLFIKNNLDSTTTLFNKGDTIWVVVNDSDLNTGDASQQTVQVRVQSSIENADTITLTEIANDTSLFRGYIVVDSSAGPVDNDQKIQALHGDDITAYYLDARNGYGESRLLKANALFAAATVSGARNENEIWTKAEGPYVVVGSILVLPGRTFTIEPGVVVKFLCKPETWMARDSIVVQGTLIAQGSAGDSIRFQSTAGPSGIYDWAGIHVQNGGEVQVKYAVIQNSQFGVSFSYISDSSVTNSRITRTRFENCRFGIWGVNSYSSLSTIIIDSSLFRFGSTGDSTDFTGIRFEFYSSAFTDSLAICDNRFEFNTGLRAMKVKGIAIHGRNAIGPSKVIPILRNTLFADTGGFEAAGLYIYDSDSLRIEQNRVQGFYYGLYLYQNAGSTITGNIITRNYNNIYAGFGAYSPINHNVLGPKAHPVWGSALYCSISQGQTMDARFNYWGSAGLTEISGGGNPKNLSFIWDYNDMHYTGTVNYAGWLSDSNTYGTPAPTGHNAMLFVTDALDSSKGMFGIGDTVYVTVNDTDLNTNPATQQTVRIRLSSGVEAADTITLTETDTNSGIFKGHAPIENSGTGIHTDNIIQALPGQNITAAYLDSVTIYGDPKALAQSAVFGGNFQSGSISASTTWTFANSPYYINGTVTVDSNVTLTIEPGVEVRFLPKANTWTPRDSIVVKGTLIAQGSDSDTIRFISNAASPDMGDWFGIYVNNGVALLSYCAIRHSRYGVYYLLQTTGPKQQRVRHCDFSKQQKGIYAWFTNADQALIAVDSSRFEFGGGPADTVACQGLTFEYSNFSTGDSLYVADNRFHFICQPGRGPDHRGVFIHNRNADAGYKAFAIRRNTFQADTSGWNAYGIYLYMADAGLVDSNRISGFTRGIGLDEDSGLTITHNIVSRCGYGIDVGYNYSEIALHYNAFVPPAWNGQLLRNNSSGAVDARYNFWGLAANAELMGGANPRNLSFIYDYYDYDMNGKVSYAGWLPDTNGGPMPIGHNATLRLTDAADSVKILFMAGDTLFAAVNDTDRNKNSGSIETLRIRIQSGVEAADTLILTETDVNSGLFKGSAIIETNGTQGHLDGKLQALPGQDISIAYTDSLNDYGQLVNLLQTAIYDAVPKAGHIASDTTWMKADGPYILNGTLTIDYGATLTLQPGVVIKFLPKAQVWMERDSIIVNGTLIAQGAEGDSIVFTSNAAAPAINDWRGIFVNNGAIQMKYCAIRYADFGVFLHNDQGGGPATSRVQHCTFKRMNTGLYYDNYLAEVVLVVDSNRFELGFGPDSMISNTGIRCSYGDGSMGDTLAIADNVITFSNNGRKDRNIGIQIESRTKNVNFKPAHVVRNRISADTTNYDAQGIVLNNCRDLFLDSNRIVNIAQGLCLSSDSGGSLSRNVILGGEISVVVNNMLVVSIQNNTFEGYRYHALRNDGSYNLDARSNYWGAAATTLMNAGNNPKNLACIYDRYDYFNSGTVNYSGYLTVPTGNVPPRITSSPLLSTKRYYPYAYSVAASDANSDALTYLLLQNPAGMTIDGTGKVQWTPSIFGKFPVLVGVKDASDTVFQKWDLTVLVDSVQPVNPYVMTATPLSETSVQLAFTGSAGNSADADSIGIWYKTNTFPVSSLDGGATHWRTFRCTDSTVIVTGLSAKTRYGFALMVRDSSGNWNLPAAASRDSAKTLDLTKPSNPLGLSLTVVDDKQVKLNWNPAPLSGTDADSIEVRYKNSIKMTSRLDTASQRAALLPRSDSTFTVAGLTEKTQYAFALFVRDSAGNWSDTTSGSQKLARTADVTKPVNPLLLSAVAASETVVNLSWNTSALTGTDVDSIEIVRKAVKPKSRTDSVTFIARRARSSGAYVVSALSPKTDYWFALFVRDSAGNWSDTASGSLAHLKTPDNTAPANVTGFAANYLSGHDVRIAWTPSVSSDAESLAVRYRTDGQYPVNDTNDIEIKRYPVSQVFDTLKALADNTTYWFGAFVRDSAGNWSTATADAQAQAVIPNLSQPVNVASVSAVSPDSNSIRVTWVKGALTADSLFMKVDTTGYNKDPLNTSLAVATSWIYPAIPSDSFRIFSGLKGGTVYYVSLFAKLNNSWNDTIADFRGATVSTASYAPMAPVITTTVADTPRAYVGQLYTLDVDAVDANGDSLIWWRDKGPAGMYVDSGTGMITWIPAGVDTGVHEVRVTVSDGALTSTLMFYIHSQYGNRAPQFVTLAADLPDSIPEKAAWLFTAKASDPDSALGDSLWFRLDLSPAGMTLDAKSGQLSWTPSPAQIGGPYLIHLVANDRAGGCDTLLASLNVKAVNEAPYFSAAQGPDSVYEHALYTRTFTALDTNAGDGVDYRLAVSPAGMTIQPITGLIQWTPQEAAVGDTQVSVIAEDKSGLSDTLSYSLKVINVNDPPLFATAVTSDSVVEDAAYSSTVTANDPDKGDVVSYRLDKGPAAMALNPATGALSWLPHDADVGNVTVSAIAQDAAGLSDTLTFTLKVKDLPEPPAIQAKIAADTVYEDSLYSRQLSALDPDKGDVLRWSLAQGPAALKLDSTSGLFNYRPENRNVGMDTVRVKVRDQYGLLDSMKFILTTVNTNDAPVFRIAANTLYGAVKIQCFLGDSDRINRKDSLLRYKCVLLRGPADTVYSVERPAIYGDSAVSEVFPVFEDTLTLHTWVSDLNTTVDLTQTIVMGGAVGQSVKTHTFPFDSWTMFSMPSKNSAIHPVLADPSKHLYQWNPRSNRYIDVSEGLSTFDRGKGYWLNSDAELMFTIRDTFLLRSTGPDTLLLDSGWNMVASPYAYAVQLDTNIFEPLFFWNDSQYVRTNAMEPWKSYFLHSQGGRALVLDGLPFPADSTFKLSRVLAKESYSKSAADWQIRVSAAGRATQDGDNYLGFHPDASDGLDPFDRFEPPSSPRNGVALAFETAADNGPRLFRSLTSGSGTHEWILRVAPGSDGPAVALAFEGIAGIPEAFGVYLGDRGRYTDLRKTAGFELPLSGETYFTVVVTDDKDYLNRVVTDYDLAQNNPNPFNPSTLIRFAVPVRFDSHGRPVYAKPEVSLKIFDMRGRMVRTLVQGAKNPGCRYSVTWDGSTDAGKTAASGVYVYRIVMGSQFVKSMKMVLMK